jgi:type II secretory pathway pseudopilin PulG
MRKRQARTKEAGYTLAVVAVFTTVLLVSLSGAVINWQKAMQREREEELIFRGKQFMRAIELWQRKFPGTYPMTIEALLSTSNTRFLRKKWKDPITNSDDWRLIKMNPDGSISGLTIIPTSGPLGPSNFGSSRPASPPTSLGGGSANSESQGSRGQSAQLSSRTGRPSQSGSRSGQSAFNPVLGGIVGIASKSEKEALKAYNGKTKYNEWEFYYVPRTPVGPQQGPPPPGGRQPQGAQPPRGLGDRLPAPPQQPNRNP